MATSPVHQSSVFENENDDPTLILDSKASSSPLYGCSDWNLLMADRLDVTGLHSLAKRLRCCGWRPREGEKILVPSLPCNLRICPRCHRRWRSAAIRKWGPIIESVLGEHGEAAGATLTLPDSLDPLYVQQKKIQACIQKIWRRQRWKGRKGLITRLGGIGIIEAGKHGGMHSHLLLVSPLPEIASDAASWILQTWLEQNPSASCQAQDVREFPSPDDSYCWLNYILKGTPIDLTTADDRLWDVAMALTAGHHRLSALGLFSSRRLHDRLCTSQGAP